MNHVWGLFSHPGREMHAINSENESVSHYYTHHVLLMAATPVACAFIGTTQTGRNFGDDNILKLSLLARFAMAILLYGVMLADVVTTGRAIWWMVCNHLQYPSSTHCTVSAGCVATLLSLSGPVALYPLVWLCALVGTIVLFYTGYLLYPDISTSLSILKEGGLSPPSLMLAINILVLEVLLAITVIL